MAKQSNIFLGAEGVFPIQSTAAPMAGDVRGRRRCGVSNVSIPSDSV